MEYYQASVAPSCSSPFVTPETFMMRLRFVAAVVLGLALSMYADARQQQQSPPPQPKKIPTLTNEDVARSGVPEIVEAPAAPTDKKDAADAKAEKKPEVSPAEAAWRSSVKQAREHAEQTQRAAEEAELHVTELRNQSAAPGQDARDRNEVLAQMDEEGEHVKTLQADAREAKRDLNKLLDDGREKGYHEEEGPSATTKDGRPNDNYYKERFDKLNQQLQDAQRRAQLYQDRVADINQRITQNSRTGDNYYIAKLQEDLSSARESLQEAEAARDKAQSDLDALMEQARQAGVPPGVFR
jgi:DNA repair exonuclease SbcCD ATPase subunit